MINRALAPAFNPIQDIDLIQAKPFVLDNGLKTFIVSGGDQEVIRMEFMFNNVNWDPLKPLQTFATHSMLREGTSDFSAKQIAEKIDYYGAFLKTDYSYDRTTLTLFALNKHLSSLFPIVKAILTDAVFPEGELQTFIKNQQQHLRVSLEKNDFLSRKIFNNALFGNTLYGYDSRAKDYEALTSAQLKEYFDQAYQPQNCTLCLSGKINDQILTQVNQHFGRDWQTKAANIQINQFAFNQTPTGETHFVEKPEALQSAIRLGRLTVNRTHSDFIGLRVLNTVLGGYFGSRLMANIREDKGYTYGIGSALVSLKDAGYFFIASEVGVEVCEATLTEIKKEITSLQQNLIPEQELNRVRHYMLGSFLGSLENILSHADKFTAIYFSGLGYDYYKNYLDAIRSISAETLRTLANQYFDFDQLDKVIVGKR